MQAHRDLVARCISLAAAAMQWPDLQTQIRAVAVCRTTAAAAGAPLNPVASAPAAAGNSPGSALQPLVVPCLLRQALHGLSVANEGHVISELVLLVRSIYISCAAWQPSPVQQIQELLPSVTATSIAEARRSACR